MQSTGIVRRIDDLGRVVIPKEVRRSMRIKEGDPLEIYTTRDGMVCFRKYAPYEDNLTAVAKPMVKGLAYKVGIYNYYGSLIAANCEGCPTEIAVAPPTKTYWGIRDEDGEIVARIVAWEEWTDEMDKLMDYISSVLENYIKELST